MATLCVGKVTFSVQLYPYLHPFGALATCCEPQRSKAGGRNKTCGIKVRLFFCFFFLSPSSIHLSELVSKSVGCAAFKRRPSRGWIHGCRNLTFTLFRNVFYCPVCLFLLNLNLIHVRWHKGEWGVLCCVFPSRRLHLWLFSWREKRAKGLFPTEITGDIFSIYIFVLQHGNTVIENHTLILFQMVLTTSFLQQNSAERWFALREILQNPSKQIARCRCVELIGRSSAPNRRHKVC